MPYPRSSSGYPSSMRVLLEEVAADNCARRVPLESHSEAHSLRARFYAYLAAIKRDLAKRPSWMSEGDAADLTEFLKRAMALQFRIVDNAFIVEPRDETPLSDKLRNAEVIPPREGSTATPSTTNAEESSLQRLLEKTSGNR